MSSIRYHIIVNEAAGGGKVKQAWPAIQNELDQQQVNYEYRKTLFPNHAIQLAKDFCDQIKQKSTITDVILAIGGDGTLHEALTGCMEFRQSNPITVPLAYLPIGSGNDFARAAKLSLNWKIALNEILHQSHLQEIYVAKYYDQINDNNGYFVNNFGIGFDAAIVTKANQSSLKQNRFLGQFSYISAIFGILKHFKSFPLNLNINNQNYHFNEAFLVTTSNHPFFGGGVKILPKAAITKPNLELIIVEKPSFWQLILFISMLPLGKHLNLKFVHHYKNKQINLTTNSLQFGQIDGEETGHRMFDVQFNVETYPFWLK